MHYLHTWNHGEVKREAAVTKQTSLVDDIVDVLLMLVGFSELCQDDQIKLIKQGWFEVILARYVPLFTVDGMFVPDMSMKVPRFVYVPFNIDYLYSLLLP